MVCSRCGTTARANDAFCSVCGNSLTGTSPGTTSAATVLGGSENPTVLGGSSDETVLGGDAATVLGGSEAATVLGGDAAETRLGGPPPTGATDVTRLGGTRPPAGASDVTQLAGTSPGTSPPTGPVSPHRGSDGGPLTLGANFGTRYHIIRLLGSGGMGAVYQAWDQTLEVAVAVKVIRPMPNLDQETTQSVERRFKRELLLARSVTHKNVVRIHDLGEIDGITYITMPYVQGSDLATILKKEGRLPVDRVLSIAKQVAGGLAAAHEAGVIHRDLKPANIMIEADGDAMIMDFGIARSTTVEGTMTATGAIVGTIEFMAPEQAKAGPIDQRVDIYAFGLILNDLLVGRRQSSASTAVAELMARMQQAPAPVRSIDPSIPPAVEALITKCLQPDPAARFQSMNELIAELGRLDQDGHPIPGTTPGTGAIPMFPPPAAEAPAAPAPRKGMKPGFIFAGVLTLLVVSTYPLWGNRVFGGGGSTNRSNGATISLAILPFRNASGDSTLDSLASSLDQVLSTELGQSPHVRTVPSDRLHQVLQDLRIATATAPAPADLARVADFTNARRVLSGQYTKFGDAIRIDATLQDLDGNRSVPLNAMAPNEGGLLTAISQLAELVRQDLARGSPDILEELKSTSWKPSTSSFEALRLYNEGMRLSQQGSHQEALKSLEAATKQDTNFALGYSALARTYANLGYDDQAQQFSRLALRMSESLPPQEKYLIEASHYRIVNDNTKAIESYENLAKAAPNDAMVLFDLGGLYEGSGKLDEARAKFAKVVELDPKFVEGLLALGRVEIRRGAPQDSLQHLNAALTIAISLNRDEARANILQAIGVAYKRLDRPDEALKNYQESLEIKQRLGNKRGMASSLGEIAQINERLGKPREAEQSYNTALKLQREIGDKAGLGTSLINLAGLMNEQFGKPDEALPLLREALQLRRDVGNAVGEGLVLNNIGNAYLAKGDYSEAQTYFERSLEIREKTKVPSDMADTLHNLGETFSKMGRFDQALEKYVRALELRRGASDKRGSAIESYSTGTIFDFQGRFGAAVKAKEEALKSYREAKVQDFWLAEILSGYANSLNLSGRIGDAVKPLEEAMQVARTLQNQNLIAQAFRFQAQGQLLSGDAKSASAIVEQATQAAAKSSDRGLALQVQADVAIIGAALQPSAALATRLTKLAQDAESLGLKTLSVECSIVRSQVLLKSGDRAGASAEIGRAVARAESLGSRLLAAKAHFQRAEIMRAGKDADAKREYASALRLLNDIKAEQGSQDVTKRADVGAMYADAERLSKG